MRRRLGAAEDALRRTGRTDGVLAARRFAAAVARLDLVAARLAVGARAVDRYATTLAGLGGPAPTGNRTTPGGWAGAARPGEIAAGARAALTLLRSRRRPGTTGHLEQGTPRDQQGEARMKDPETALRSLLNGRLRGHERGVRGFDDAQWRRYGDLLAGALLVAVRRRFAPGQDRAPLIRFVAAARERFDVTGLDVDPARAEALIRAALDECPSPPEDAATVTARTVLLLGLLEDEGMTCAELDDLVTAAAATVAGPRSAEAAQQQDQTAGGGGQEQEADAEAGVDVPLR